MKQGLSIEDLIWALEVLDECENVEYAGADAADWGAVIAQDLKDSMDPKEFK